MRIWQANLGRGVSVAEFIRNLRLLLEAAGPRAFVCLQEIDEADLPEELDILRDLTVDTHDIVGGDGVPILVPRHVQLVRRDTTPACRGLAHVTPHRVVTEVTARIPGGLSVSVFDTHLPINRPTTRGRRARVRTTLRRRVRARQTHGDAVVWSADTNTHTAFPKMARRELAVIDAGIDKTRAAAPPGWRMTVSDRRTIGLSIDGHNAHGARILFERT